MTKGIWRTSAVEQPMNGQPVWVYYTTWKEPRAVQAVFEWVEFGHHAFRWRAEDGSLFYGHGLWQPRLTGETPEPPPVEKPK